MKKYNWNNYLLLTATNAIIEQTKQAEMIGGNFEQFPFSSTPCELQHSMAQISGTSTVYCLIFVLYCLPEKKSLENHHER